MTTPLHQPCPHAGTPCPLCRGTGYAPAGVTLEQVRALHDERDGLRDLLVWCVAGCGCDSAERRAAARALGVGLEELDARCRRHGGAGPPRTGAGGTEAG